MIFFNNVMHAYVFLCNIVFVKQIYNGNSCKKRY